MTRAASPRGYQPGTLAERVDALLEERARILAALAAEEADIRAELGDEPHGDPAGCGGAGPW